MGPTVKESPPSSPGSESMSSNGPGRRKPHMLGNQLNPTSTMAQKMSDTLSQELEAHSIFTEASNSTTNLVGPQLHSRVIASVSIFEINLI